MVSLPASIESYLQEAGFTATEILVLKRLLEGSALTLREMATKTGKSTGVLDQATKKLIERKIVTKENINDTPKYAIASLESITHWMQQDMHQRHAVLDRKRQDFEAFLSTVQHETNRPDMEYFEGADGIERAFTKLLEKHEKEWLHFNPALTKEEEDPMVQFRVQLFRKRRNAKTFMRVLSPDCPLAHRYKCRDVFEYRDTRLVQPEDFPVAFEQYIVGDTVACFDIAAKRASFIRYPEHADGQRKHFHVLWCQSAKKEGKEECEATAAQVQEADMETKVLSGLREFFMGRQSVMTLAMFAVASALITFGLYQSNQSLNFQRMQDKVVAIARTGALQVDANDLNQLQIKADYKKPEWKHVVTQLKRIKDQNEDIVYVYIFRKNSEDPKKLDFVADAESINPYANSDADMTNDVDANRDGIVEPNGADYLQWPGQPYDVAPAAAFESFSGLKVTNFYEDQWGKVVTGYAPIKDKNNDVVAVFAVDMKSDTLKKLTNRTFVPFYAFFALFVLFVIVRLAIFHRSLVKELFQLSKTRKALISFATLLGIALVVTFGMYKYTLELMKDEIGQRLMSIAATAVPEINAEDLDALHIAEDMRKPEYQRVFEKMNELRNNNMNVGWVYILRKTEQEGVFEFVADADSNYFLPQYQDANLDGILTEDEEAVAPGVRYSESSPDILNNAFLEPTIDTAGYTNQWGAVISAFIPIEDSHGNNVAILGVDMNIGDMHTEIQQRFNTLFWFLSCVLLLFFMKIAAL